MEDFMTERTKQLAKTYEGKQFKYWLIVLLVLFLLTLIVPFLGWRKIANGLASLFSLVLMDVLAVIFARWRINFIFAIVLGGIISFILACLLFFYVSCIVGE